MELTREIAERYVGGQLEITNPGARYRYGGEIATCTVTGDTPDAAMLVITLKWMAKGESLPSASDRWVNNHNLEYSTSLLVYGISDMGNGQLRLDLPIAGETIVLFPPGGSRLDPSEVEGLNITE